MSPVQASHDVLLLHLELSTHASLLFYAGQFARLNFGVLPPRIYSMASQPDDPYLEFDIRIVL